MCDTLWRKNKEMSLFLKNSDRAANEPNLCIYFPRGKARGTVECTYISIPDTREHFATLLVKPSWMWGAEMGVNEYGVCIGNEAVFTTSKNKKIPSLIGMDFVRLALERSKRAEDAVQEIISLLKEYGQGGNCGFDHKFYYDNSYLITDENNAFILETAGKDYALKNAGDCANISNRLSLSDNVDDASIKAHFTKKFTEPIFTFFSGSKNRMQMGHAALSQVESNDLSEYFNVLRKHNTTQEKCIKKGSVRSVCMHAGLLGDHTTCSMVVTIKDKFITAWVTGSSTPCLSLFKPLYFNSKENFVTAPCFMEEKDSFEYWLKREKLNRAIYGGIIHIEEWLDKVQKLEKEFIEEHNKLVNENATLAQFIEFSKECSKKEAALVNKYSHEINNVDTITKPKFWVKKTKTLGKNVFERELCNRIK